jgi:monofunctional biosynthetic peptidoglycan transglycosylase
MSPGSRKSPLDPAARRRRLRIWLARLGVALALVVTGYYGGIFYAVWRLRDHNPRMTAFMRLGLEHLRAGDPRARLQHRWVPYDRISVNLKRAVIASEDQRFLDHDGFDLEEMEKAHETNARAGRIRHGASTISQQLAKNLFLSPKRTYLRKAHEAVITMMLERLLTKRRIFEIYLNVIEWGDGIYGAEAAAQHYYEEPAADLSPRKAARLAAMIPSPRFYTRNADTPYLDQRTEVLLDQMEFARIP